MENNNKNLYKLIKLALMIALTAAVIVLLDHIFIPKYINENQDGRITGEFYDEKTELDVIGIGSSTMYNAMAPALMWNEHGFTSYVRSNASQTLWQSYYLLKDAVKYNKPKLVVLDVSFIKYGQEFVEEPSNRKAIEGMRDPMSKLGAVRASMYEQEQPLSYFMPVLRYHSRWKELTADDVRYAFGSENVTYDGYLMEFSVPDEQNIYEPEAIDNPEFPDKALVYLNKIIEYCDNQGIQLLLMKTPTYENSWHKEYDEMLSDIAADNGIQYVNFRTYSDDMGIDVRNDYIDDGSHFNVRGASKFSSFLGDYLAENYELSDRRSEEKTASVWNSKYQDFKRDMDEGMAVMPTL